jgi:hypothetical protein
MSFNSNTKGVTCGTEIVYASPPMVFRQIRVDESVFICVDSSVDHCLSFYRVCVCPLYGMSSDLPLLITLLVSSNPSCVLIKLSSVKILQEGSGICMLLSYAFGAVKTGQNMTLILSASIGFRESMPIH